MTKTGEYKFTNKDKVPKECVRGISFGYVTFNIYVKGLVAVDKEI